MADLAELATITTVATVVNVAYNVKHKRDVGPPLIASGLGFVALATVGQLWRWDIVVAVAGLFLLSTTIMRGIPLLDDAQGLIKPAPPKFTGGGGTF